MNHVIENRQQVLITSIEVFKLLQAFLEVLYLFLYDNDLFPQLIDFIFIFVKKSIRVDCRLDCEWVVSLRHLLQISVVLKSVQLKAKNFGKVVNPSRFLSSNWTLVGFIPCHLVAEGILPGFVEISFGLNI